MITLLFIIGLSVSFGYCLSEVLKKRAGIEPKFKKTLPSPQTKVSLEEKLIIRESITTIEKLSEIISSSLNLKNLANEIVMSACRFLNAEVCALLLLNEETDTLSIIAATGIEEELLGKINIELGKEISGVAAKFKEIIIINDLEKQARSYKLKYDACYKNSLISAPLSLKNKTLGVLNISNRKNGEPFSAVDVDTIKIIALESAIALQNFKLLEEEQKNYLNTIISLANAIDARDPYTHHHSRNVTAYALRIAQEMKLPTQIIENIKHAGLLHDIGKIGIKDEILFKTENLNNEEWLQIKKHPLKGEEIIKSLPFLAEIAGMIRHHHERFDGHGYPQGIKGKNIELGARILTVADSFDAMTSDRPYRKALSLEGAKRQLINGKGTQFDPEIVDCFLQILEKEPRLLAE